MLENVDEVSKKVTSALMTLIEVSSEVQKSEFGLLEKRNKDTKAYLKEFCTVGCRTARGSGHTRAIINAVMTFGGKSIILTPNQQMAERTLEIGLYLYGNAFRNKLENCCSIEIYRKYLTKIVTQPLAVFIDVASFVPERAIDSIYDLCKSYSENSDEFFIVLVE